MPADCLCQSHEAAADTNQRLISVAATAATTISGPLPALPTPLPVEVAGLVVTELT